MRNKNITNLYLLNCSEDVTENLSRLITSAQEENVCLALQLIDAGGLSEAVRVHLLKYAYAFYPKITFKHSFSEKGRIRANISVFDFITRLKNDRDSLRFRYFEEKNTFFFQFMVTPFFSGGKLYAIDHNHSGKKMLFKRLCDELLRNIHHTMDVQVVFTVENRKEAHLVKEYVASFEANVMEGVREKLKGANSTLSFIFREVLTLSPILKMLKSYYSSVPQTIA